LTDLLDELLSEAVMRHRPTRHPDDISNEASIALLYAEANDMHAVALTAAVTPEGNGKTIICIHWIVQCLQVKRPNQPYQSTE